MRRRLLLLVGLLTGCAGLIGVPDLTFDEQASQGNPDGSSTNDGAAADGTTGPGLPDGGAPCDPMTIAPDNDDPKNCGRCGHDCLGGACVKGMCQSVVLKDGLAYPANLVADATSIYVATFGDGAVRRVPKSGGPSDDLVFGHEHTRGLALGTAPDGGALLLWSNYDLSGGDGGGGAWGAIFGCNVASCKASTYLLKTQIQVPSLLFTSGALFFVSDYDDTLERINVDGTGNATIATASSPWSLAVDGTHFYTHANVWIERVQLDGGSPLDISPGARGGRRGTIAMDATRVYWAYGEYDPPNRGVVRSAAKADPASIEDYKLPPGDGGPGSENRNSHGVAVDDTRIYWTNLGTFTGVDTSNKDGQLVVCAKTGCETGAIVLDQGLAAPGPVVVDEDAIYYVVFGTTPTSADGQLRRIAKP